MFLCSDESGPEHFSQVSVDAVDPEHQGECDSHERPGDAIGAGAKRARVPRGRVQFFTGFEVIPSCEFQELVQQDDGQGDFQHHQPLGHVQRRDLKDHLRTAEQERNSVREIKDMWCQVQVNVYVFMKEVSTAVKFVQSRKTTEISAFPKSILTKANHLYENQQYLD